MMIGSCGARYGGSQCNRLSNWSDKCDRCHTSMSRRTDKFAVDSGTGVRKLCAFGPTNRYSIPKVDQLNNERDEMRWGSPDIRIDRHDMTVDNRISDAQRENSAMWNSVLRQYKDKTIEWCLWKYRKNIEDGVTELYNGTV